MLGAIQLWKYINAQPKLRHMCYSTYCKLHLKKQNSMLFQQKKLIHEVANQLH